MNVEPGRCYYRKAGLTIGVRKVLRLEGQDVYYQVLCGGQLRHRTHNRTRLRRFLGWAMGEIEERDDYSHLNGCKTFPTFLVRNTRGEPILRCNEKKARFYLRKGYAREVEPGVLQYTNDVTETRLGELYSGQFGAFFTAVKNDRCVVCGKTCNLTRHHIVPQRLKKKVPQPYRSCLSNVLFTCMDCHEQYEQTPAPEIYLGSDPLAFCRAWEAHFLETMRPRFLPRGWSLVSVKNIDKV